MGDPVEVSPEQRQATRTLAAAVATLPEYEWPDEVIATSEDNAAEIIKRLCLEIVALTDEKQAFCRAFQVVEVTEGKK